MVSPATSLLQPSPLRVAGSEIQDEGADALEWAAEFYAGTLVALPAVHPANRYLQARGFSADILHRFRIGFAHDRWHGLQQAARQAGFSAGALHAAGLLVPRRDGRGYFDRFRGALVFPFTGAGGRVLGFAARRIDHLPRRTKAQPLRYVNTPATAYFRKREVLFGLVQAREAIERSGTCILVEGYTDVLALHQCALSQSVAVGGTVLFEPQARYLARLFRGSGREGRVLLAFDADEAGRIGMRRALPLLIACGLTPEVVMLPSGKDVAEIVSQAGRKGILGILRRRRSFTSFVLDEERRRGCLDDPASHAEAVRELLALIRRFPDRERQVEFLLRAFAESRCYSPRFTSTTPEGEAYRLRAWCAAFTRMR